MSWPEASTDDHDAPWNVDQDEETGEWVCSCTSCKRRAREEAQAERRIDDFEFARGDR
jgi:hypothetical protein